MPFKPVMVPRWGVAIWFLIVAASFAVGLLLVQRTNSKANRLAHENQSLLAQIAAANERQTRTIKQLCDRGYIVDGAIVSAVLLERKLRQIDREQGRLAAGAAREGLIREFDSYHAQLLDSLTDPDSLCVS